MIIGGLAVVERTAVTTKSAPGLSTVSKIRIEKVLMLVATNLSFVKIPRTGTRTDAIQCDYFHPKGKWIAIKYSDRSAIVKLDFEITVTQK